MSYQLKRRPEDFIVEEVIDLDVQERGILTYFRLKKRDYNTLDAVAQVSKAVGVRASKFKVAGNKDKHAVTTQLVSCYGNIRGKLGKLRLKDIEVEFVGMGSTPINLGSNVGNRFTIVVRNLDTAPLIKDKFINLFGEQRFGQDNVEVGRLLMGRDFSAALEGILGSPRVNRALRGRIEPIKNNPINALRQVPRNVLRMYMHAYQSYLWNETVLGLLREIPRTREDLELEVPLIGFGFDPSKIADASIREAVSRISEELMKREGVRPRDFIIRELPHITAESVWRKAMVQAKDVSFGALEPDELNEGKKKMSVRFFLPKGSYATEFIRQSFEK